MPATVRQNLAGQPSASLLSASRIALRDRRDERDGGGFEVRSSRFSELRTQNFEFHVALFPPVSPVSLGSGIGDDVCICFLHPFDLVNLCDHHIREGSFVCDTDE